MSLTAIVVAVEEEFRAIRKRMARMEELAGPIRGVAGELGGQAVLLVKSGMGAQRAFETTHRLIETHSPDRLIIAGFCAGLKPGVNPGDIILATNLAQRAGFRASDGMSQVALIAASEGGLLRLVRPDRDMYSPACGVNLPGVTVRCGAICETPRVLRSAEDKERLAAAGPSLAADMESGGAATACRAARVPWLVVRAVTDGLGDAMPLDFDRFVDPSGEPSRGRIAAYVALRPWLAPALIRLGERSALAARNLALFVEEYLEKALKT